MNNQFPRTALLLFSLAAIIIACFTIYREYVNNDMRKQLEQLEGTLEDQRQKNLLQLDSLQQSIAHHQAQHQRLKDSLSLLQEKRTRLTKRSNEKKAAIIRIADVDSLYREVAGHYE